MKKNLYLLLLSLLAHNVYAQTPQERGLEIANQMDRVDSGFINQTANLEMVLKNAWGDETRRVIRVKSLEVNGDGDKSLTIFDYPKDVKGTAFLSFTHSTTADDQWLYLPALKRVKRISSKNKSGPFVGSEFAFEDLTSQEVDKYKYEYLRDDTHDGRKAFVVNRYPAYQHSGYSKQTVWVDAERFIPLKVEFYDRQESLLKTLVFSGYRQYLDKFWRADQFAMQNHQTKKGTMLNWSNYQFQTQLAARDFDRNSLKRIR